MSDAQKTSAAEQPSAVTQTQKDPVEDGPNNDAKTTAHEADAPSKNEEKPAAASERKKGSMVIIMVALGMAIFLAALDVAVVTTALPAITSHFKASQAAYSWIGSAYLLTYAAITPFWAKSSDIFGRKPILLAANIIFFVGSLVCALSNSAGMLIAGRAVQGAGGGGLIVLVNITIGDLVSMR